MVTSVGQGELDIHRQLHEMGVGLVEASEIKIAQLDVKENGDRLRVALVDLHNRSRFIVNYVSFGPEMAEPLSDMVSRIHKFGLTFIETSVDQEDLAAAIYEATDPLLDYLYGYDLLPLHSGGIGVSELAKD